MGVHTKYKPEYDEQAYNYCLLGATDAQLAGFFNVTEQTINNWKKDHPSFFESLKAGKVQADAEVAQSLFHRAKGYSHADTHISNYQGDITQTEVTKFYPPDTTAAIFWLKNRNPDQWRDRKELDVNQKNEASRLSDDQLADIAASGGTGVTESPDSKTVTH